MSNSASSSTAKGQILLFWGKKDRDSFYFAGHANISGKLYFLSNFFPCRFELDGYVWHSTEHYFQAMKFAKTDSEWFKTVRDAHTAAKAAALGRSRKHSISLDWDTVRDDVMMAAVYAKFSQNAALRSKLRDTGNAVLHEDAKNDFYWGAGNPSRIGQDKLGKLLMEVRSKL